MNPWIDVFGWMIVAACVVGLRYEIPRAVREIKKILAENRALQRHIGEAKPHHENPDVGALFRGGKI
mgnify:CR=1 FL=1